MAPTVAVVGLGSFGLVTLKNLREEGLEATGFERSAGVGGLWKFEEGPKTTATTSTIANVSKYRYCYTDFPFQESADTFPTAAQLAEYLDNYAKHFSLGPHIRVNSPVQKIARNAKDDRWEVSFGQKGDVVTEEFDKVVLTTGINCVPFMPTVEGIEKFKGRVLHSNSFKRPEDFHGQRVVVVGLSNSAGDTATALMGHAKGIYLSHRSGSLILPRWINGKPADLMLSYRGGMMIAYVTKKYPSLSESLARRFLMKTQNNNYNLLPSWNLEPTNPFLQSLPLVNDDFVPALHAGTIVSKPGIRRVLDKSTIEMTDGSTLTADAIIFCTGYKSDLSILGDHDPSLKTTPKWDAAWGSNSRPLPRLYRSIFTLSHPQSLAVLAGLGFQMPVLPVYDLASMALARVWAGRFALPSLSEMAAQVDDHHRWMVGLANRGSVYPDMTKPVDWMRWVNDVAGTGVNENLGYGSPGWKFWFRDRTLCAMLMDGVWSPHMYRLFDTGKRKAWSGAKEAIEKVNRVASSF